MTIVFYIPFGGFLDFCTIVKYPFPAPIPSTLTVLETQVSHQRSSGGRMDDDTSHTSHTHHKSLKLYMNHVLGDVFFVFYFCGIFCFLCPPQNTGSLISDKNFTRIILCKSFFWMTCVSSCLHTYLTMTCCLFLSRNKIPNSTELGAGGNLGWSCVRTGSQDVENR